jgi:HSP20 family molecular chaperone IbpA
VQVVVRGQELLLEGVRPRPESPADRAYSRVEIEHGPFQRRISLGEEVDSSAARTTFERGMLTIVLPIATRRPPSSVSIVVRTSRA